MTESEATTAAAVELLFTQPAETFLEAGAKSAMLSIFSSATGEIKARFSSSGISGLPAVQGGDNPGGLNLPAAIPNGRVSTYTPDSVANAVKAIMDLPPGTVSNAKYYDLLNVYWTYTEQDTLENANTIVNLANEILGNVEDVPENGGNDAVNMLKYKGSGEALKVKVYEIGDNLLDEMETLKGHTIERHVGKTREYLAERAKEMKGKGATTFADKAIATKAVQDAISKHANEIVDWIENSNKSRLVVDTYHTYIIGYGVLKSKKIFIDDLKNSRIILEKSSTELGFRIITSYPTF